MGNKMESSIFLSGPLKGVFWYFKVERRVLTSGTVCICIIIHHVRSNIIERLDQNIQKYKPVEKNRAQPSKLFEQYLLQQYVMHKASAQAKHLTHNAMFHYAHFNINPADGVYLGFKDQCSVSILIILDIIIIALTGNNIHQKNNSGSTYDVFLH